jgi:hypothetical protein
VTLVTEVGDRTAVEPVLALEHNARLLVGSLAF